MEEQIQKTTFTLRQKISLVTLVVGVIIGLYLVFNRVIIQNKAEERPPTKITCKVPGQTNLDNPFTCTGLYFEKWENGGWVKNRSTDSVSGPCGDITIDVGCGEKYRCIMEVDDCPDKISAAIDIPSCPLTSPPPTEPEPSITSTPTPTTPEIIVTVTPTPSTPQQCIQIQPQLNFECINCASITSQQPSLTSPVRQESE